MDQPLNPDEESSLARLDALSAAIVEKRDAAVKARKDSGIEQTWLACEEAYLGIDEKNRPAWAGSRWAKPTSMQGPVTVDATKEKGYESTLFVRLTSRYVDAGAAKVAEILLPIDDKPFSLEPSPSPELALAKEIVKQQVAAPMAESGQVDEIAAEAQQVVNVATDSAKKAEKRIYDWLVEAKYPAEMRKVIFDAARCGAGVLKAPFADVRIERALSRSETGVTLEIVERTVPSACWVDFWNLFPDPACGEDIHNGSYCLEQDFLSPKSLEDLKRNPNYLSAQIDKVLAEGPDKCLVDDGTGSRNPAEDHSDKGKPTRFRIWHYYGTLTRDELLAAQATGIETLRPDATVGFAIVTLANDTVIRAVLNPLDSGGFPYRVFNWSRRAGNWAGVGVAEQAFVPQRIVNAATRRMMNNAGKSSGAQIVVDNSMITPADKRWEITPYKLWLRSPDAVPGEDMRKAFNAIELPNAQEELMRIIEYGFKLAEESTNIPLISQGQSGDTTPDTYGAAALQDNNANQLLRNVAAACDDTVTEPVVRDFYEWLLLDPDVPNNEKGDFQINAHGSTALVERAIQGQVIQNLVEPSINPAFGLNPKLVMQEYLRSKRIDPRSLSYTEEELSNLAKQTPPLAPAVQAAQIRAQAQIAVKQLDNSVEQVRIKRDTDRDTVYVQSENTRTQNEFASRREELAVRRELALIDYANKHQLTLEQIKGKLAETVMKLRTQKELAIGSAQVGLHKHHNPVPQVATPAMEPPGRAPAGEAFQK